MFSYVSPEARIPEDHPLRATREMTNRALVRLDRKFRKLYSHTGRPSVPPEQLLRALLLQVLYSIRSERMLMEQLEYNLLFRWFVGLEMDDRVWDVTVFTKNRDRLLEGAIAESFFQAVLEQARLSCLRLEEALLDLLREHRHVPDPIVHLEPYEPTEQQVVLQLLHQHSFASNRVEHLEQESPEQLLRRHGRPPSTRVQLPELPIQPSQGSVRHLPRRTKRVVLRNPRLRRHVAEHLGLRSIGSAHLSTPDQTCTIGLHAVHGVFPQPASVLSHV